MARCALKLEERVVLRVGLDQGDSLASIARRLGRSDSTIVREVNRNRGRLAYEPVAAQRRAERRVRRPKIAKLVADRQLGKLIDADLRCGFSPAAIVGRLRAGGHASVCHETIYQALYSRTFRGLTVLPAHCLRTRRRRRNPYRGRWARDVRNTWLSEIRPIERRPKAALDRRQGGHWEGDLLMGSKGSNSIVTLIDRASRYVLLAPACSIKHPNAVAAAIVTAMETLPRSMRRSLTWDRGNEMIANWPHLEVALDMPIYFCNPYAPWERPSNENLNRQLRFWLPKKTDLSDRTQRDLDKIANVLNNQPRRIFNWATPAQRYAQLALR